MTLWRNLSSSIMQLMHKSIHWQMEILGNLDEILGDDPDLTAMHIQLNLEQM